jgi:hypothetical protein
MFSRYQYGFIDIEDNNYLFLTFIIKQANLFKSLLRIAFQVFIFKTLKKSDQFYSSTPKIHIFNKFLR